MAYATPLQDLRKDDVSSAGGKGANLGELTRAGFPVPPGFVLTIEAYDTFVRENHLQQPIVDCVLSVPSDSPPLTEETSATIQALISEAQMPQAIRADLLAAYAALTADGQTAVAVRSSATTEDAPTASFAGQHDTYLGIQGEAALLDAVKNCWASLWTARAIAYRRRQNVDPATVSLAVVVQQFVPADVAGILFTANPTDGDREHLVINAAWGLGEAIVAGMVTPDSLIVDKASAQILSRRTATKTTMTVRDGQGTAERPVPPEQQNRPVIDDRTVIELAKLGIQIEKQFGLPMDVEWAIAGGQIAILQARPVTGLPPAPLRDVRWEPPRPGTIWMRRQVVEHMPEPLSPLFDELYLQQGLDHAMGELAVFLEELSGIDIDVWDFLDPPFATTINGYAYSAASFNFSWKLVPIALRMYVVVLPKMIRHLVPRWREHALPTYQATIERWKRADLHEAPDEVLLQGVRELAAEDAAYWFDAAVPLGLARTSDAALDRFLKLVTKGRGRSNGHRLTSGSFLRGFPSKTVEAQAQLEAIARKIGASDALRQEVIKTPARRLLDLLQAYPEIMDTLRRYLDTYGHQIYNLDFAAPTLADEPLPVLLSLKTAVAHPERDILAQQTRLAAEREALAARTERSLNPILRPLFKQVLARAQRYAPNREEALFYVGAAWPALRRLALELGRRLADAGSLDIAGDVFYLRTRELAEASAASAQGYSRPDLAKRARERRALREARKRLEPPVTVPPEGRLKFGPIDMAMFEPKSRRFSTGPTLDGFAVSPGKVTATASVIRLPEAFDEMAPDTILVCTTTTPAWTPLFARARGLVTDIGGALAHGSIVAREYGIPAVMGTGVATQRIKSGQRILVDGDQGTVTMVDEVAAETMGEPSAVEPYSATGRLVLAALAMGMVIGFVLWLKRRRSEG